MQNPQPSSLVTGLMANAGIHAATNDNSWDYISQLSQNVRVHIFNVNGVVNEACGFLDGAGRLVGEAAVLVRGIMSEIEQAANDWKRNYEGHVGRTGFGKGPEEHAAINQIGLSYIQIHEVLTMKTAFIAPRLQEIVTQVEHELNATQALAALQQTPVIDNGI